MNWLAGVVIVLAVLQGGWLALDGARALTVGDYRTPKSGAYAGQLGPWSRLVSAIGLDPRSRLVKAVHLALGVAWLVSVLGFALGFGWGWWGLVACAIASLWYLPFGTLLSLILLALLLLSPLRSVAG